MFIVCLFFPIFFIFFNVTFIFIHSFFTLKCSLFMSSHLLTITLYIHILTGFEYFFIFYFFPAISCDSLFQKMSKNIIYRNASTLHITCLIILDCEYSSHYNFGLTADIQFLINLISQFSSCKSPK